MADPKLERVRGSVGYTSDDGYTMLIDFNSRATKSDPKATLMSIIDEAVRVASLYGHGDEALETARAAYLRVKAVGWIVHG